MYLLIVAATEAEVRMLKDKQHAFGNVQIDFLVTGVGMVATTFQLTRQLFEKQYDLVINAGIAGAFNRSIQIGDVVEVEEDRFYELGAEDHDDFISADRMGLLATQDVLLKSNHGRSLHLSKYNGITVNKVHGKQTSIDQAIKRVNPDVESMEGAAVFYVCDMLNHKCVQIRGISNYVEPRNKSNWNIQLAITNMNTAIETIIRDL